MPNQRTGLVLTRTTTFGLIVLALGYAVTSLLTQIGTPLPSFAASYVATSVALHVSGAPIYDYGTLLRLNAVHKYVTVGFYPCVAPPFALLALAPLTLVPFPAASVVWLALTRLCMLGAALAISDAANVVIARRSMVEASSSARLLAALRRTSLQIGGWQIPAALASLCSLLFLFALPPLDTLSWNSLAPVAVLFVAVALDAYVRGRRALAALAVALASGFSFLPLVLVVCVFLRGTWKAAIAALLFAAAVAAAPLLLLPVRTYSDLANALRFAQAAYGSSDHNISLSGAASTSISALGHFGTRTFILAGEAGALVSFALIAVTLAALLLLPIVRRDVAKTGALPGGDDSTWLIFAVALSASVLALPLVWPDDSAFALIAVLLVGMYPFIRTHNHAHNTNADQHIGDAALFVLAVTALILYMIVPTLRLDSTGLRLLDYREFLYLAQPLASLITWAAALGALFAPYPRLPWLARRTLHATAEHDVLSRV